MSPPVPSCPSLPFAVFLPPLSDPSSSVSPVFFSPRFAYPDATSKAAANNLTRILAASLARKHITVNAIAPGVFPTLMSRHGVENNLESLLADQPTGRLGTSEGGSPFLPSLLRRISFARRQH